MAKRHSHENKKGHRTLRCELCEKPQQYYAQADNLKKHIRVFHNGGKTD